MPEKSIFEESINIRVKKEREFRKITQAQMAHVLGMERSTYAHMEKKGNIPIERLKVIARYMNLSLAYLTADKETIDKNSQSDKKEPLTFNSGNVENPLLKIEPFTATHNEQALLKLIRKLPADKRSAFFKEKMEEVSKIIVDIENE